MREYKKEPTMGGGHAQTKHIKHSVFNSSDKSLEVNIQTQEGVDIQPSKT